MTALAPMTRITDLHIPPGTTAAIHREPLGPLALVRLDGLAYGQIATARTIDGVPPGISLAVRPRGSWTLTQGGITRSGVAHDLVGVVDVTREMRLRTSADTPLAQLFVSADQLGMGVDAIRAAATVVERSPLRDLVANHVLGLPRGGVDAAAAGVRHSVGLATIELVRAMLIGATRPEERAGTDMSAEHLRTSVKRHVHRHLREPDLTPATIAAAHAVSLRHLYGVWQEEPTTLSRWIALRRLDAARQELADPGADHRSIAAIARGWCFTNPTSFARAFRDRYGMTPREWRRAARTPR